MHSVDVTANYPSAAESDEFQLLQFRRASDGEVVRVKSHCISGFNLTIGICAILEDVLRATCSVTSKQRICRDFEAAETLRMNLWGKLQRGKEENSSSAVGLRTNGQFRPVVPPVAIMNSMVGDNPPGGRLVSSAISLTKLLSAQPSVGRGLKHILTIRSGCLQ